MFASQETVLRLLKKGSKPNRKLKELAVSGVKDVTKRGKDQMAELAAGKQIVCKINKD